VTGFGHEIGVDADRDVLIAIREFTGEDLGIYSDSLTNAFESVKPIFTSPRYAEFFWHCATSVPGWIPQVVLGNAAKESEGSEKLFRIWQQVDYNREVEEAVLRHAKDESRHSRLFLELTRIAFPDSPVCTDIGRLDRELPDVRKREGRKCLPRLDENQLIDSLVQINIGEIRTRIHVLFFAPVIHELAPRESRERVKNILFGLVHDEVRHIGYTATLMERWARTGDRQRIHDLYRSRLAEFSRITVAETEDAVRKFGQNRFPELLEI